MANKLTVIRENKFSFLSDPRISFKAKGILWFMLNPPEGWDHTIGGLAKFTADGKASINSGVNELKSLGYIEAVRTRGEGGRYGGSEYIYHDTPING